MHPSKQSQVRTISWIVEHYLNSQEMPIRTNEMIQRAFKHLSPRFCAVAELLTSAATHNMIGPVGETIASVVAHSDDYTRAFIHESDKLMTAYGRNTDLPHVLAVGYGKFFPNQDTFETLAHAFDGTAVTQALKSYSDSSDDYRYLATLLHAEASKHKTSSPLGAMSQVLTRPSLLQDREQFMSHDSYHVVSKSIMDTAAITKDSEATRYLADVAYRHIDDCGMHLIMDLIIANARKLENPTDYIPRALAEYDGNALMPKLRRQLHNVASRAVKKLKSAA